MYSAKSYVACAVLLAVMLASCGKKGELEPPKRPNDDQTTAVIGLK